MQEIEIFSIFSYDNCFITQLNAGNWDFLFLIFSCIVPLPCWMHESEIKLFHRRILKSPVTILNVWKRDLTIKLWLKFLSRYPTWCKENEIFCWYSHWIVSLPNLMWGKRDIIAIVKKDFLSRYPTKFRKTRSFWNLKLFNGFVTP